MEEHEPLPTAAKIHITELPQEINTRKHVPGNFSHIEDLEHVGQIINESEKATNLPEHDPEHDETDRKDLQHAQNSNRPCAHKGTITRINHKFTHGYVSATSKVPDKFENVTFFFKWKQKHGYAFKELKPRQEVEFDFEDCSPKDKPSVSRLRVCNEYSSKEMPIITKIKQARKESNKDKEKEAKYSEISKDLKKQRGSFNPQTKLNTPLKQSQMIGTIVAIKNTDTDSPYGFIQPREEISVPDQNNKTRSVMFHLRNVKPAGITLARGDNVKFILKPQRDKGLYASRVYVRGFHCDKSEAEIEDIIKQMLASVKTNENDYNEDKSKERKAYAILNLLNSLELWKSIGDSQNLTDNNIEHLCDLVHEVKHRCDGLNHNFTHVLEAIAETSLFSKHPGYLNKYIKEALLYCDRTRLDKIMHFLLTMVSHVPSKISAITSIIKPMLSEGTVGVNQFLWRVLKVAIRNQNDVAEDQEWTDLPLVPSPKEILEGPQEGAFNLQPAIVSGPYDSAEDYLDTNFRLLRADCFNALNKGIRDLLNGTLDKRDMHAYHGLKLYGIRLSEQDVPLTIALEIKPLRKVRNWEKASNFMYGNLVCISANGSFQDPIWATVSSRDLLPEKNIVVLEPCTDCNQMDDTEVIYRLQNVGASSLMVESPSYYKSFQPILKSLQSMQAEKLPFRRELVEVSMTTSPCFYTEDTTIDAGIIYDNESNRSLDEFLNELTSTNAHTTLDKSQEDAIKNCLRRRVAIVQGPPGTGKTYIGAKLVQLINSLSTVPDTPILVLTYKNHALDEFMKHIGQVYPDEIARVGGRQQDPAMDRYNLSQLKRYTRKSYELVEQISEYRSDMESVQKRLIEMLGQRESKMYMTVTIFLAHATSEQLSHLLERCNWLPLKVHSLLGQYKDYMAFRNQVKGKSKPNEFVDKIEIEYILGRIGPIKDFLCSYDMEFVPYLKSNIIILLTRAFGVWLPNSSSFEEIRSTLNETIDTSNLVALFGNEQEQEKEENEDNEESRAKEQERLAAIGGGKGDNISLSEFHQIEKTQSRGKAITLFPIPKQFSTDVFCSYLLSKSNIWTMSTRDRVLFIQVILHKEFANSQADFQDELTKYKTLHRCKSEIETIHSVDVLRDKQVVGMTITGASIHASLIKQLKPAIVIVEEAAEVMEPQLLSILGPWVKQLILIGDQKQLRPNVESYELKRDFNLDVSMMERLINNGMQYSKLNLQNRMRPEFAEMLKDIYPDYESNLLRVGNNNKPASAVTSMFFWTHSSPESGYAQTGQAAAQNIGRSYRNEEEAERCIKLALFFIQQGHKPSDITILGAYLGQVRLLRREFNQAMETHSHLFGINKQDKTNEPPSNDRRIIIQTIDNYQGDENEIVIISLVRSNDRRKTGFLNTLNRRCVAQSRAKCGMFFMGNNNTIESSKHWQPVLKSMEENGYLGPELKLQCPKHEESQLTVRSAADITLQPFCFKICDAKLPCDLHRCEKTCQPRHHHERCDKIIPFVYESCGHPDKRKCFQELKYMKCKTVVEFLFPCSHTGKRKCHEEEGLQVCKEKIPHKFDCGHVIQRICSIKSVICQEMVEFEFPCGHKSKKKCTEDIKSKACSEEVTYRMDCNHIHQKKCFESPKSLCDQKVSFEFPCGHFGKKSCFESVENHQCTEKCTKTLEACGHLCSGICSQPCIETNCKDCAKILAAKERKQQEEERRKRNLLRKQIETEIDCIARQIQRTHITPVTENGQSAVEYFKVRDMFMNYIQNSWYPSIISIEKIYNSMSYVAFLNSKRAIHDPMSSHEKFFGTNSPTARKIAHEGFRGSPSGLRFTTDPSASTNESHTTGTILLCDVLIGKPYTVDNGKPKMNVRELYKSGCDSLFVKQSKDNKNEYFVVFDPNQALAKYIIKYKREPVKIKPLAIQDKAKQVPHSNHEVHQLTAKREIDLQDPLDLHFRIVESQFHRLREKYTNQFLPDIDKIEYHIDQKLVNKFEVKQKIFEKRYKRGEESKEILAFHGTSPESIRKIVTENFDTKKVSRQLHGFGMYFSEFPAISKAYGDGLLLCRVLPGKSFVEQDKKMKTIPPQYDSITVKPDEEGRSEMLVIADPDQILPCYVIYLKENKN